MGDFSDKTRPGHSSSGILGERISMESTGKAPHPENQAGHTLIQLAFILPSSIQVSSTILPEEDRPSPPIHITLFPQVSSISFIHWYLVAVPSGLYCTFFVVVVGNKIRMRFLEIDAWSLKLNCVSHRNNKTMRKNVIYLPKYQFYLIIRGGKENKAT